MSDRTPASTSQRLAAVRQESQQAIDALRRTTQLDRLERLTGFIGIGYALTTLSHFALIPPASQIIMVPIAALSTMLCFMLHLRLKRRDEGEAQSVSFYAASVYGVLIVHSLARLALSGGGLGDLMFIGVLVVAIALIPAKRAMHMGGLAFYISAWSAVLIAQGGADLWRQTIPPILLASCISILMRHLNLARDDRVFTLRLLDQTQHENLALAEERLHFDAHHDRLTGLPNRVSFTQQVTEAFEEHRVSERSMALLYLDLDRFKVVNDSLGHAFGDRILMSLAHRLRRFLRPHDVIARFGGDEFAILLTRLRKAEDTLLVSERLHEVIEQPFRIDDYEVQIATSIGIALGAPHYASADELLRDADIALGQAKRDSESKHLVFDRGMHTEAVHRLQLEMDLRQAIKSEDAIVVHFQPVVRLDHDRTIGVEALVRWQHPERGLLNPFAFLGMAEETGLIVPLGWRVFQIACQSILDWQAQHPDEPHLKLSVNLSVKQFVQTDFESQLLELLAQTRFPPQQLWLEITENSIIDQLEQASAQIERLQAHGIRVAIDDFGVGYSSLGYLQRLPFDVLKLDRSFLMREEPEPLIEALLALGRSLDMEVVVEGVETAEHVALLRQLGCPLGQGYHFARPAPLHELDLLQITTDPERRR